MQGAGLFRARKFKIRRLVCRINRIPGVGAIVPTPPAACVTPARHSQSCAGPRARGFAPRVCTRPERSPGRSRILVRGSLHAHAYALELKKITGVEIEKMLPTPNIDLDRVPECQKYLDESKHRRLYTFSPEDYAEAAGVWSNDEVALPGDPPGPLEVVEGFPEGGKMPDMPGTYSAFSPDYAPEEMFEVAKKLYKKSR